MLTCYSSTDVKICNHIICSESETLQYSSIKFNCLSATMIKLSISIFFLHFSYTVSFLDISVVKFQSVTNLRIRFFGPLFPRIYGQVKVKWSNNNNIIIIYELIVRSLTWEWSAAHYSCITLRKQIKDNALWSHLYLGRVAPALTHRLVSKTLTMHLRSLALFSLTTMTPADASSTQWTSSPFTTWSRTTAVWKR